MVALAAVTTLASAVALAAPVDPSPHRQITGTVGNCVFSSRELKYQKDDSYVLATSFKAPDQVYARCYFPKRVADFRDAGKIASQLRGVGNEPPRYNRRLQFARPTWNYAHTVRADGPKNSQRDQSYMWITRADCDFKDKPRTGACIDLEQEVRKLAAAERASLPYTTEICVVIDFDLVDERVPNPKNRRELIDKKQFMTMAKGCFTYTVE